ncbi:hypothetical protein [Kribbella kalugense]|uniref:Uncharacterized protein n=1 Tax=Kribbella kalugense TaxID=2512221 RepID=A0A4R7ZPE8_9ACTN|nr:hypothetical protein [Kribbella kalugense]TDW18418.1 hypothetical protein EV650_5004 [Kribbella kalugense]
MSDKDYPKLGAYRELSELERIRRLGPNEEWVPLDVTGEARYSAECDRIRAMLRQLDAYDGGMLWDSETATLTIQMTSEDALQEARLLLLVTDPTWLRVMFVQVQYPLQELNQLASRLFEHQNEWAGASGFSGGVDQRANRLELLLDGEHPDADLLIRAVERLADPRIKLEVWRR